MIDQNVLLVRADLRRSGLSLSNISSGTFADVYSLGPLKIPCGWISALVQVGDRQVKLLETHLQSPVAIDPTAAVVQVEQATQLVEMANSSSVPVVIAGDFNSDAILGSAGPGPDNTETAANIAKAGYADAWTVHRGDSGVTWPFYAEDQLPPPPFVVTSKPYERIDLIFSKGLNVLNVDRVTAPIPGAGWPYFGSDHAGVIAKFHF
jgi:endonuclease/exonuclease/phosphatase family metal-dependent hydrolase